jgi:hypothetical protein
MRIGAIRWIIMLAVLTPFLGAGAGAQPPAPGRGAKEAKETDEPSTSAERAKLQAELLLLLKRISASAPPVSPPMSVPPSPKTKDDVTGRKSIDAIREGMNLFRDNDFEGARRVFQLIDPTGLSREDRAFVRYMLASSLRRQNRLVEAEVIYREVGNNPDDDEFLANLALWQISLIRTEQDLQLQLEQLRARAKSK